VRVFELTTLGRIGLTGPDGAPVATLLAQPKRLGVLVYLAIASNRGVVRRETLCETFWPDVDMERARTSLRQTLAFLRRAVGDETIIAVGDDDVSVDAARLRCDVQTVRACLAAQDLSGALALYHGEFMAGFAVDDVPRFDRWLEDTRSLLARDVGAAALTLAQQALARNDASALTLAQRAQEIAPLDERALVALLEALNATGDRSGALRAYDVFERRLRDELDLEPAPETVAAAQAIRSPTAGRHGGETDAATSTVNNAATNTATNAATNAATTRLSAPVPSAERARTVPLTRPGAPAAPRWLPWLLGTSALIAVASFWYVRSDRDETSSIVVDNDNTPRVPRTPRVLVTPFVNETGDANLDALGRMAADWITEGFSRVDGIAVVPGTAVLMIERARAEGDESAPLQQADVARETGATMIVSGSYYRTGGTLHLQARLTDAATAALLRPAETVSVPADSAMQAVSQLRERLLAGVAPLLDSTTHFRFANTPPTYAAYRDFLDGFEQFVQGDLDGALQLFERAYEEDTTYRMPQLAAAITESNRGDMRSAYERVQALKNARDRFGPVEQGTLDMIDGMLRGDIPSVYTAVARTSKITPGSIVEYMVGETSRRLNRPTEALRVLQNLDPERGELRGWRAYWRELAFARFMAGDHRGALDAVHDAQQRYADDDVLLSTEIRSLAALGMMDSVVARLTSLDARPGRTRVQIGALFRIAAVELMLQNRESDARAMLQRSVAWYESNASLGGGAGLVRTRRLLGDTEGAQRVALAIADTSTAGTSTLIDIGIGDADESRLLMRDFGVLAAMRGDLAEANEWEQRIVAQQYALPDWARGTRWAGLQLDRAAIAAQRGEHERAVGLVREALSRGLGFWPGLRGDPDLLPLKRNAAWVELMKPSG
jgi:DNA-binding SARP family transcriptional activator/TolB-like protein